MMPVRAITYLLLAMLFFAIQDSLFKYLTQDFPVLQLLMTRMVMVVCMLLTASFVLGKSLLVGSKHQPLIFLRGTAAFSAFTLYYLALQKTPIAESATVLMTAPLFVTAFSVPILREKVGIHRWAAVCIGFVAVIVMLRPGTAVFNPIMVLPLISAIVYSLIPILTRIISSEISAFAITFYTTVAYLVWSGAAAIWVHVFPATSNSSTLYTMFSQPWQSFNGSALLIVAATAILFCVSITLVTLAYRIAQASAIASFEYFYLVWAVVIGYLLFGDVPSTLTLCAAAVIIGCGIYITWREHTNIAIDEVSVESTFH